MINLAFSFQGCWIWGGGEGLVSQGAVDLGQALSEAVHQGNLGEFACVVTEGPGQWQ